jgi:lactoylglutathione lyase
MSKQLFDGAGIFVPVKDLERSARWYTDNLGFEINHWDESEAVVLKMGDGYIVFCLVKCDEFETVQFPKNNYAVDVYFNFHTVDVDGLHKKLTESEVKVTEMYQLGHHRFFTFFDPDGNKYGAVNSYH